MAPKDLIEKLTRGNDQQAEAAVRDFVARNPDAIPDLKDMLASSDPNLRWWAVRALALVEDPQVPDLLRSALHDSDTAVRQCAALALRRQPCAQAIPDLIALLQHPDGLLARLAADALIATGEEAVPPLLEVMKNDPQAARLQAVRALALIGDSRSIDALFNALDEPSAVVEYWADEGLERMGIGMVFYKPGG